MEKLSAKWRSLTSARQDMLVIAAVSLTAWFVIEKTETCDRFFEWVAENPDAEADSLILAFLIAAVGVTIFAWRRYREMLAASAARDMAEQHVRSMAYHDPLTGLPNRRALNEYLKEKTSSQSPSEIALIFMDLDRFKAVNDMHGHMAGDRLLRLVAKRLVQFNQSNLNYYRLGGDEFAAVLDLTGISKVRPVDVVRHIIQTMAEPFEDGHLVYHIGASAGIAVFPGDATDTDGLVRAADVALYRAKDAGRNRHRCYEAEMDEQIRRRALLEQELREGVAKGEFLPFYQPIVDLGTGRPVGVELLARWARADGEDVGPDQFIPVAEECGLITDLMLCLVDRACVEARDWDPELTIAINISPVQFRDPWLSQKLLAALMRHGFPPKRFAIEITENAIISDEENAIRTIESFKNQGMLIGLDDFGTGYASLHHLRLLPFDKIKIDRSFITNIDTDTEALKITKAIVGLAHHLDLPIIAEGIEKPEVVEVLLEIGCTQGQGYHFGRPVPAHAVEAKGGLRNPCAVESEAASSRKPPKPSPRRAA